MVLRRVTDAIEGERESWGLASAIVVNTTAPLLLYICTPSKSPAGTPHRPTSTASFLVCRSPYDHHASFSPPLPCHLFHSHDIAFISAWTLYSSPHLSPPISPIPNLARSCCSTIHLLQSLARFMNIPAFSFINTFAFICFRPCGYCFPSFSECL